MCAAAICLGLVFARLSRIIPADDIKYPRKTIPYATMIGTVIASIIYVFGTLTVMKAIPHRSLYADSRHRIYFFHVDGL